jgi:hypothetical protein
VDAVQRLSTVTTDGRLAQRAVPVRQKPTTVLDRTLSRLFGFGDRLSPKLKTLELSEEFGLVGTPRPKQTVDFLDSKSTVKFDLGLGEEALLAFKQNLSRVGL